MKKVLIIDDELGICQSLMFGLMEEYETVYATDPEEGIALVGLGDIDAVILDVRIGSVSGLDVLRDIKKDFPHIIVIMMTAYASDRSCTEAMRLGAYTYLSKPVSVEDIKIFLVQALEFRSLNEKIQYLSDELNIKNRFEMIGKSEAMNRVYTLIDKLKDVDTNIMITGESGTGKELAAKAIHFQGKRQKHPFLAVNCAAVPEHLIESEFFGHKKGAFTGAAKDKLGKFAVADKGTLFLDEIGELPFLIQGKLLRAIQEHEITPVGSNETEKVDVRILAATNRDLRGMVREGTFREDLYYRLNVIEIPMPPLRQRKNDLSLLLEHYVRRFNEEQNKRITGFTPKAYQALLEYDYPGNVRQLGNVVEHAVILAGGDVIDMDALPYELTGGEKGQNHGADNKKAVEEFLGSHSMKEIERLTLKVALEKNNGKKKETAWQLGISERTMWNKVKEYGLSEDRESRTK